MDVLISENLRGPVIDRLAGAHSVVVEPELWKDHAALTARIAGARAIIVRNQTQLTAEVLEAAKQLQVIGRNGVGLDNIDMEAASRLGIVVVAPLEANATSVAELTFGLLLSLARRIPAADQSTRAGGWERLRFVGTELSGKTIAICGFGRIGRRVAEMAKGFGMRIVAYDPYLKPDAPALAETGATLETQLIPALAQADCVTVHSPLTPQTRHLFNATAFAAMRHGAYFVNSSRGGVVDEAALVAALRSGHLGGAALDVREVEPPGKVGELESLPNIVLTPHIAAFTAEAQQRTIEAVAGDVGRILRGEPALNAVNFPQPRR